jgi:hypothetical protein
MMEKTHSPPRMTALWYWRHFDIEVKLACVFLVVNTTLSVLVFAFR